MRFPCRFIESSFMKHRYRPGASSVHVDRSWVKNASSLHSRRLSRVDITPCLGPGPWWLRKQPFNTQPVPMTLSEVSCFQKKSARILRPAQELSLEPSPPAAIAAVVIVAIAITIAACGTAVSVCMSARLMPAAVVPAIAP